MQFWKWTAFSEDKRKSDSDITEVRELRHVSNILSKLYFIHDYASRKPTSYRCHIGADTHIKKAVSSTGVLIHPSHKMLQGELDNLSTGLQIVRLPLLLYEKQCFAH